MPQLVPVDYDPFGDAPQPKAGQTITQPTDQRTAQKQIASTILSAAADTLGVTDAARALRGEMTPEEAQTFALGALPMLVAPEAKTVAPAERLAMDAASRLERAQAMGFRTDMPLYHGSGEAFSSFRAVPTTAEGMVAPGVSTALDPAVANEFAQGNGQTSPQVYPLFHRAQNPASVTLDGSETHGEVVATLRDAFDRGHDAVMLKNYTTPGGQEGKNIVIVHDANQLRSPQAAFDPAQKFSPELLAGIGGMAAIPAAGILVPVDHNPFGASQ